MSTEYKWKQLEQAIERDSRICKEARDNENREAGRPVSPLEDENGQSGRPANPSYDENRQASFPNNPSDVNVNCQAGVPANTSDDTYSTDQIHADSTYVLSPWSFTKTLLISAEAVQSLGLLGLLLCLIIYGLYRLLK